MLPNEPGIQLTEEYPVSHDQHRQGVNTIYDNVVILRFHKKDKSFVHVLG